MSYSGAGLYDDDAGHDARTGYRELVADGLGGEEATDALVAQWGDALLDADEAAAFWLALADTQWRVGRLEDRVRDRAFALISSGEDLARFAHDRRLHARRAKVLADLETRLRSPQRPPARIRKPFRSVSPVGLGDVFWFPLPNGGRVLLRCVHVDGDDRESRPTIEVLDWDPTKEPEDTSAIPARKTIPLPNGRVPADLLYMTRSGRDPDPTAQITVVTAAGPVTRRRRFPCTLTWWVGLPARLKEDFGLEAEESVD